MSDDAKKIFVDDDWKAEAKREKERLAATDEQSRPQQIPPASFAEVVNIVVMQVMAALGMLAGPGGERMPVDMEVAKHYIDLLQLLEDRTKGNLTAEEKQLLDQVLYETRMMFVQVSSAGAHAGPGPAAGPRIAPAD